MWLQFFLYGCSSGGPRIFGLEVLDIERFAGVATTWWVQGKALLGGPEGVQGGEALRKLHDFSHFEGFDNHFWSMIRLMHFHQSTIL
ncbi:hypothetical protein DPMN_043459 [Dreissena polymorpha]|uniref:Uncharacterized protein n=1 Tax=Dreissena polymorpha TaxID=45954 RepID=A0A9D4HXV4_DREPO|nr:hypothetical protein DPMN_043459 [Dreissena polymorpha]